MLNIRRLLPAALTLCVVTVSAQQITKPDIGYLYPAGGRQGSTIRVTAGGQFLRGATDVYVSGQGVKASVIQYMKPVRNLNQEQRKLLQSRMKEVRAKRLTELGWIDESAAKQNNKKTTDDTMQAKEKNDAQTKGVKLPDHPLWYDIENKSLRELAHITTVLFNSRRKSQPNRQIAESVLVEIIIAPDAKPGNRELRIETPIGLTNPMVFQVGPLPEIRELEPNNQKALPDLPNIPKGVDLPKVKPLELPVLLNGQIMPGDVDRFRFRAQKGQKLVIQAHARSLIPYLADAVPGWFQATLALYDSKGNEVAFADDYRFNPDPVLFYEIAKDDEYELEIRDSIYRGREDFIYRIAVSEQPFITQMFPLGGRQNTKTTATFEGFNLPQTQLTLDTQPNGNSIRQTVYNNGKEYSNPIAYAVDTLPERNETESNNSINDAQQIELPMIINGRINTSGDVDVFHFKGRTGEKIVAEVYARRLNSPLDSVLRLTDQKGNVIEWNDDHMIKDSHLHKDITGLVTHHADSYLLTELPKNGIYYVHLADSQNHGGDPFAYRLRIAKPQGDFALRVTPSSLKASAGGIVPLSVHALRKDGFKGKIEIVLKDALGFKLDGQLIPPDRDHVWMTLTTPKEAPEKPLNLQLQGQAEINGKTLTRSVVPAEDMMQAFLYRHLVPSQELLTTVKKVKWRMPVVELIGPFPIQIPAGGSAEIRFKTPRRPAALKEMDLVLHEPLEGITLHDVKVIPKGLACTIKVDKEKVKTGFADNLIIEAFREFFPKQKDGKTAKKKRRSPMGFFPAVPIEIVKQ
jgi:hypothetical protein